MAFFSSQSWSSSTSRSTRQGEDGCRYTDVVEKKCRGTQCDTFKRVFRQCPGQATEELTSGRTEDCNQNRELLEEGNVQGGSGDSMSDFGVRYNRRYGAERQESPRESEGGQDWGQSRTRGGLDGNDLQRDLEEMDRQMRELDRVFSQSGGFGFGAGVFPWSLFASVLPNFSAASRRFSSPSQHSNGSPSANGGDAGLGELAGRGEEA